MALAEPEGAIPEVLTKVMIYFGGPFFVYPFKPIWNRLEGSTYPVAFSHFRADHMTDSNVLAHLVCLVGQLGGNFGLLNEIDDMVKPMLERRLGVVIKKGGIGPISSLSAAAWMYELSRIPAPTEVKALSCAAIFTAYKYRQTMANHWETLSWLQMPIEVMTIHQLVLQKPLSDVKGIGAIAAGRLALQFLVSKLSKKTKGSRSSKRLLRAAVLLHLGMCASPPIPSAPYLFGLYGWVIAKLTGNAWVYLWSMAYIASFSQGLAHHLTDEPATLPALQKVSDELAHVGYFPAVLFQSALLNLKARRS